MTPVCTCALTILTFVGFVTCRPSCLRHNGMTCERLRSDCVHKKHHSMCNGERIYRCKNMTKEVLLYCECECVSRYPARYEHNYIDKRCIGATSSDDNDNMQEGGYQELFDNSQEHIRTIPLESSHSNDNMDFHNPDKYHINDNVRDTSNEDEESDNDTHRLTEKAGPNENVKEHTKSDRAGKHKTLKEPHPSSSSSSSPSSVYINKLLMLLLVFVKCLQGTLL